MRIRIKWNPGALLVGIISEYNYCRKQLGNSSKSQRWNYCNDSAISL